MLLSKKDEIVAIAKMYVEKYNIDPLDAVIYAIEIIEKELEANERD